MVHNLCVVVLVVAACHNNTTVEITLRGTKLLPSFKLDDGQVFQYLAEPPKRLTIAGKQTSRILGCLQTSLPSRVWYQAY